MPASPLSEALLRRAGKMAKATGAAYILQARGVTITVLPDAAAVAQVAPVTAEDEAQCDEAFGLGRA